MNELKVDYEGANLSLEGRDEIFIPHRDMRNLQAIMKIVESSGLMTERMTGFTEVSGDIYLALGRIEHYFENLSASDNPSALTKWIVDRRFEIYFNGEFHNYSSGMPYDQKETYFTSKDPVFKFDVSKETDLIAGDVKRKGENDYSPRGQELTPKADKKFAHYAFGSAVRAGVEIREYLFDLDKHLKETDITGHVYWADQ